MNSRLGGPQYRCRSENTLALPGIRSLQRSARSAASIPTELLCLRTNKLRQTINTQNHHTCRLRTRVLCRAKRVGSTSLVYSTPSLFCVYSVSRVHMWNLRNSAASCQPQGRLHRTEFRPIITASLKRGLYKYYLDLSAVSETIRNNLHKNKAALEEPEADGRPDIKNARCGNGLPVPNPVLHKLRAPGRRGD